MKPGFTAWFAVAMLIVAVMAVDRAATHEVEVVNESQEDVGVEATAPDHDWSFRLPKGAREVLRFDAGMAASVALRLTWPDGSTSATTLRDFARGKAGHVSFVIPARRDSRSTVATRLNLR